MLKLEQLQKNSVVSGIDPNEPVRVVSTEPAGPDAVTAYYKTSEGKLRERMLFRADEASLSIASVGRPWAFDAPGEDFKLAAEAFRINLAYLFDPMIAVHTSNVDPLPHQITAVYESMLPRQPLRFILADDPGAGKTIMAGLLIRELIMRADAYRILIVAPGSLVEQWQDEMREKFSLDFRIFGRDMIENTHSGNPFEDQNLLIARLDQISRNADLRAKLASTRWDLIVIDEAHKLSASNFGNKVDKTQRFQLGELLGSITRHFLLMTATPHNGKEDDFQLWLSLLDGDRFYGKARDGATKTDASDLMRRMVKEDLLKFDGTRLFPERFAKTVNYALSPAEANLYEAVTQYVREEMNKADNLGDDRRKGNIGFALTGLQRRLASSPEAILRSLERRSKRLTDRIEEAKLKQRGQIGSEPAQFNAPEDADDLNAEEAEELEEALVDQATASQTIAELQKEIVILDDLVSKARRVRDSGVDRKWEELRELLHNTPEMHDSTGRQRKLIIFTEHRDTLNYLKDRVSDTIGNPDAVVVIHGGVRREHRRDAQERFRHHTDARVLIATDAAGEGVNLQTANLMVNYDLPWNPNRIEQRFGRIHRIGQQQTCHLWNMVASGTREGEVFQRLFEKLEIERAALGGRVFDILGEVFEEESLRDLLIRAIRQGEDPEVRRKLREVVEGALDTEHLKEIISRNALCQELMDEQRLFAIREQMEKAEARKLQPYFIRAFFKQAFEKLGGDLRPRETGRFEIANVPAEIREHDRLGASHTRRYSQPVQRKYERICFEREKVRLEDKPDSPPASLVHPAHPLMQAIVDIVLLRHRSKLKQGAILVDTTDLGNEPRVMFILDHSVVEGANQDQVVSRRLQFVEVTAAGKTQPAGWAPHLDLVPIEPRDEILIADVLAAPWITADLEQLALAQAATLLVPEHFEEVRTRREKAVDKTLSAVHERLVREIDYWSEKHIKLKTELSAGRDVRLNLDNIRRTIDDLDARLKSRKAELLASRNVVSATPVVVGGALVIPKGLLLQKRGAISASDQAESAEMRAIVERIAMERVIAVETALGHTVKDVSAEKIGWDITAQPPQGDDGVLPEARHIEVKGRAKGSTYVTVTRNEVYAGYNQGDKFLLALVFVEGKEVDGPYYVKKPFNQEPDWAVTSQNLDVSDLLSRAEKHPVSH